MRVQLPDVRIPEFEPGNSTPDMQVTPVLRRAVQRYLMGLNRMNKLVADVNLSIQLEQLNRRRCKVGDVAQLLERAQVARVVPASVPQLMYVHDELMELHRGMTSLATLKDTLDHWVMASSSQQSQGGQRGQVEPPPLQPSQPSAEEGDG